MAQIVASLPLLTATLAILLLRQSALRGGAVGLILALCIVLSTRTFALIGEPLMVALLHGVMNTMSVSYVLLGGVWLYQVLKAGGALDVIAGAIVSRMPDPCLRLLVLVFGVSVFFESSTGFGVGIVVVAPLFLALGFRPIQAAMLALIGQCAVPFGALSIGTVLGAAISGVSLPVLGAYSVLFSIPFIFFCGFAALVVGGRSVTCKSDLGKLLLCVCLLCSLLWFFSVYVSVELAGCLAGLVLLLLGIVFSGSVQQPVADDSQPIKRSKYKAQSPALLRAALPFVVLMSGLLLTRLVEPIDRGLASIAVLPGAPDGLQIAVFHHAGFWLALAALVAFCCLPVARAHWRAVYKASTHQWLLATLAVGCFLCLGQLMQASGMTGSLAGYIANLAGQAYVLAVPLIGGLGGFLTASNAASNALFMSFQLNTANQLGVAVEWTAAAQNAAGSNTTLASPGRLVFAATVAGRSGAEHELLWRILPLALAGVAGTVMMLAFLS